MSLKGTPMVSIENSACRLRRTHMLEDQVPSSFAQTAGVTPVPQNVVVSQSWKDGLVISCLEALQEMKGGQTRYCTENGQSTHHVMV
jgi:hypothetical protein